MIYLIYTVNNTKTMFSCLLYSILTTYIEIQISRVEKEYTQTLLIQKIHAENLKISRKYIPA